MTYTELKKPDGFLGDGEGNFSSMRLAFLVALVNAVAMGWVFGLSGMPAAEVALMIAPWLTVAFGAKVGQSFAERPRPESPAAPVRPADPSGWVPAVQPTENTGR